MARVQLWYLSAIVVPVVTFSLWIGSLFFQTKSGTEIKLKISGYDPRDLLSGHYLRYRIDYGNEATCGENGPTCLCLTEVGGFAQAISSGACDDIAINCAILLRGACNRGQFSAGIEQFYFSEKFTKQLALVPPNASIQVRLSRQGHGVVTGMFVDELPLLDWLQVHSTPSP